MTEDEAAALGAESAARSVYRMLRQGIVDGAALPEVQTEADVAAHRLLGCANYDALRRVYETGLDLREAAGGETDSSATIMLMADEFLMRLTRQIVASGEPAGMHCGEKS